MAWITPGSAQTYLNVGNNPIPMQPLPQQGTTTFPYQDPVTGASFNADGTNSQNPVISAGTQNVSGVTYNLQTLTNSTSITFKGQNYTVYSAVPQANTINYAYQNCTTANPAPYYDATALTGIDFTIPNTINGGNSTGLAGGTPSQSPYTKEMVYLTTPPTDSNSLYFIPNLPNSAGSHNGLTANIYFVSDPFIGKSGYQPTGPTYHLTPYGWASVATLVSNAYQIGWLDAAGGNTTGTTTINVNTPFNYWKHIIQGYDSSITNIATQIMQGLTTNDPNYPFPSGSTANYLNWLATYNSSTQTYTMNGIYMHVQPQPGFQRNLLRYYTAWGAVDIYSMSSDLFVRADGTIELPAVQNASGAWQYAPIVTQTWDGSQRFTLLNQTKSQVPSTYDDYPGYENYSLANVYLPGQAGVVTSYINYWVWDGQSTGSTPTAREMDLWLGLKGMSAYDVQMWDTAGGTEPGGQGGKPYMFGATTTNNNGQWSYQLRLQASNSFGVARVASTDLQGKLYDASFYANFNDGKGYQKAATISTQWQPWTIVGSGANNLATWNSSSGGLGAGVATLTYANVLGGQVGISANQATWNAAGRTLYWTIGGAITPSQWNTYNSSLNNPIWGNYIITGTTSNPNYQYLIVLNPAAYFTLAAGGDWGTAANWSSGAVPDDNHNVYLLQGGTVTYNNILATAPPLSMLQVDGGTTLQINSASPTGDLVAEMAVVGVGNQGTLTQSAGTVTLTDNLYLGHAAAGTGTYNLQGGTFSASNVIVGFYGTGTVNQSGGTATISNTLTLAGNSGSSGTYTLTGGTLTVDTIQQNSGGTLTNNGGTLNYTTWNKNGGTTTFSGVGFAIGTGQTFNQSGGSLQAGIITVDTGGVFNQTGGTLQYNTFNHNGGATTFSSGANLSLGAGQSYTLSGGSLTTGNMSIGSGGTFTQTGGSLSYNALQVNGQFVGDLVNTTSLSGSGTITGNVVNSGTVNPGNSPGTLNIVGSYTQTGSGIFRAEIASATSYDKISVTGVPGTAVLNGTIAPILYGGYRPRAGQIFPGVVTATWRVTGTFAQVVQPLTLKWTPLYNTNSVDLLFQPNYANPSLGLTSNGQAVGNMLNEVAGNGPTGDLGGVLNAIDSLNNAPAIANAYKQISAEKAGALGNLGLAAGGFQVRNLANRTTNLRFIQGGSGEGSSLTPGGLSLSYSKMNGLMLAYNGASLANLFSRPKEFQKLDSRWGLFLDGGAAFGNQDSTINQTGYNFTLGGFTAGADYRLRDNLLMGLATGYSNTNSGFYSSGGNVRVNTVPFNAYAAYFPGSFYAYGSLGYALNLFDLERNINFGNIGRRARSSTIGHQFNLYGETGYDLKLGRLIVTPTASLAFTTLSVGGFSEKDAGALNLKVASQSANSLQTSLGGRVTFPLKAGKVRVVPQVYAFYQHEFANGSRGLNASLSQGSSTFNFQTDAPKRNYALVGTNVMAALKKNLYAQANFNVEVGRTNSRVQNFNAGLRWEF